MKMGNEVQTTSSDIHVIASEIKSLEASMVQHFIEHAWLIGERLTRAKKILPHGKFLPYINDTLSYTPQYARSFMSVYADSPKGIPSFYLPSLKHLFEISTLPKEIDRQQFIEHSHTIPSTGEVKTVDEMTVRELREVKKALQRKDIEIAELESRAKRATEKAEQAESARQIAEEIYFFEKLFRNRTF